MPGQESLASAQLTLKGSRPALATISSSWTLISLITQNSFLSSFKSKKRPGVILCLEQGICLAAASTAGIWTVSWLLEWPTSSQRLSCNPLLVTLQALSASTRKKYCRKLCLRSKLAAIVSKWKSSHVPNIWASKSSRFPSLLLTVYLENQSWALMKLLATYAALLISLSTFEHRKKDTLLTAMEFLRLSNLNFTKH